RCRLFFVLDHICQFVVPALPVLADKWFFQELVYLHSKVCSKIAGGGTDAPTIVIQGLEVVVFRNADWVQVAGNRLLPADLAIVIGLLNRALQYALVIVQSIGALSVFDGWGRVISLKILNVQPLLLHGQFSGTGHIGLYVLVALLQNRQFVLLQWCAE